MLKEFWNTMSELEKWDMIKTNINTLLAGCDWTQLPDSGLTIQEKIAWQEYRLALQELYTPEGDPDNIVFPEPPAGVRL